MPSTRQPGPLASADLSLGSADVCDVSMPFGDLGELRGEAALLTADALRGSTAGRRRLPQYGVASSIDRMSTEDRVAEALRRSVQYLPGELAHQVAALFTPQNLAIAAGVLVVWALSHAAGVGFVVDAALLALAIFTVGMAAFDGFAELYRGARKAIEAESDEEIDEAARHFASAITLLGVSVISAALLKRQLGRQPRTERWWRLSEAGPVRRGTSIPRTFTLTVRGQSFRIKPNATKHLAERASTAGLRHHQVEFPYSSLAGSLEQTVQSGALRPLLRGEVQRLGTVEHPYRSGDWELGMEVVDGTIEVFHAVMKTSR